MSAKTIELKAGQGMLLRAMDLLDDEGFIVTFSFDPIYSETCRFEPVIEDGEEVRLTVDNPTYMAYVPGFYRVEPEDPGVEDATVDVSDPFPLTVTKVV